VHFRKVDIKVVVLWLYSVLAGALIVLVEKYKRLPILFSCCHMLAYLMYLLFYSVDVAWICHPSFYLCFSVNEYFA